MKVYENEFVKLEYYKENKLIVQTFLEGTKEMTNEIYQENQLKLRDFVRINDVIAGICDTRHLYFSVPVEMQDWNDKTVMLELVNSGIKKAGFLMSPDFIAQIAVEQIMEEEAASAITTKYFENMEDAKKWVLGE